MLEKKTYKCEVYSATFTDSTDLKKHAVHSGKKLFECKVCSATFYQ